MQLLDGILLGAVQGLTEFLPISSSGHLVLVEKLLESAGREGAGEGIFLEVCVHAATLLAIVLYYRRRLLQITRHLPGLLRWSSATPEQRDDIRLVGYLGLASVPAGLVGILFKDALEKAFEDPRLVLAMLAVTGAFLIATRFAPSPSGKWSVARAAAVGVAQAAALLPGVSRSGSTIGTALFLKSDGEKAAEFSFLMAIPAIGGAAFLEVLGGVGHIDPVPTVAAFATAFVTGYGAILLLLGVLRRRSLWVFGPYCLAVAGGGGVIMALT